MRSAEEIRTKLTQIDAAFRDFEGDLRSNVEARTMLTAARQTLLWVMGEQPQIFGKNTYDAPG